MANQKLRYEVDVNARDGIRELDKLGKAGKEAGEDIEKGLEDAESAGKQAAKALVQAARDIETELKADKEAAEALARALGPELAGKIDTGAAVAELKTLGLTADDVKADADTLAIALKEIDDIRMDAVRNELTTVDQGLSTVRTNSDQSRSVMANLAGNAAQDLGQLGGVVGSLGVGIGQLAEYAVDGNIALSNLAKVAGPMALVAAGLQLITTAIGGIKAESAFKAQLVQDFSDALREGVSVTEQLRDTIEETGQLTFETGILGGGGLLGLGSKAQDLIPIFNELGISAEQFFEIVQNPAALQALKDRRDALRDEGDLLGQLPYDQAIEGIEAYITANEEAILLQQDLNQFLGTSTDALGELNESWQHLEDPLSQNVELWDALRRDIADGTFDFENAADAVAQLADETGRSEDEIIGLLKQDVATRVTEIADAFIAAGEAAAEQATQIAEAAQAVAEYDRVASSADWGEADFVGATTAYEEFRQAVTGDRQQVAASEEAWDGLGEAIDGAGSNLLDMTTGEGRQVFDALDELGTSIVPDLAQAFADSDGDIDKFRRSTDRLATQTLTRLQEEFGVSEEDAKLMIAELGLLPEQVTTFYELAGDEAARVKLGLLQGVIDGLPEDVQTEVAMHILADDPVAALDAVERAVSGGVTTPMHADTAPAMEDYRRFKRAVEQAAIVARIVASGFFGGSSGVRSVSTAPSSLSAAPTAAVSVAPAGAVGSGVAVLAAPAPPARPVIVNLNAAVIGDRYGVQRVVTRAVRSAVRLGGTRS